MTPFWDTSSMGIGPDTKPMDIETLGEHKAQCARASSRWLALHCGAGQTLGFIAARPVTAGVALTIVLVVMLVWP